MPPEAGDVTGLVLAYQDVRLLDLRARFAALGDAVLDGMASEMRVASAVADLRSEIASLAARLVALGEDPGLDPSRQSGPGGPRQTEPTDEPPGESDERADAATVAEAADFDTLSATAQRYLADLGIDARRDPLLQVLPSGEALEALRDYAARYGDPEWSAQDWGIVLLGGLIGGVLDLLVVRTPGRSRLLGHVVAGSELDEILKRSGPARAVERWLEATGLAERAHVGYDASTARQFGRAYRSLTPSNHRSVSFGHDPSPIGAAIGIADLMRGAGSLAGPSRTVIERSDAQDAVGFGAAVLVYLGHLASDVATPMGLPAPMFTLLSLIPADAPFVLPGCTEPDDWAEVARWAYVRGYDLRHAVASGIVAGAVELVVRGYCLLGDREAGREPNPAKQASMLLVAQSVALAEMVPKLAAYGFDPTSINWAQLLVMPPVVLRWLHESSARDARIEADLAERWRRLAGGLADPSG